MKMNEEELEYRASSEQEMEADHQVLTAGMIKQAYELGSGIPLAPFPIVLNSRQVDNAKRRMSEA